MDITVSKRDLLRITARCQGVAQPKSSMPALANLVLATTGVHTVRSAATDLYLSVSSECPAEVKSGGSVCVSAKDLHERVKAMPDGPVHVTARDGGLVLKAGSTARRYTLRSMPADDYPKILEPAESAAAIDLGLETLALLMARTHFAILPDESRPALNCALFEHNGSDIRMIATDGHRLCKMVATTAGPATSVRTLLPLRAIAELRRHVDEWRAECGKDAPPPIKLQTSESTVFFTFGTMRFSSKIVASEFPPYELVIPRMHEHAVRLGRAAFADALRAVSVASSDRAGGVKLEIGPGVVRVTSESPDRGDGFDEVKADYQGPVVTMGFNARYLLDVLGAVDGEEVRLEFGGELDPAVLRPVDAVAGQEYTAIVMPMRV